MTATRDIRGQLLGTLSIVVSFLFVLCFGGISFAADKVMHVTGEVIAVDTVAGTLTVRSLSGDLAVTIDNLTRFSEGKTLDDVRVGDKVTVSFAENDAKVTASRVQIGTASLAKEQMKEERPMNGYN